MDKLVVTGLGKLDGEYDCNLGEMLSLGSPEALTNREGHRIKQMSGVRAGELDDALEAGDNDVMLALAAIVLSRAGKTFDDDVLWDAPMGSGVMFHIGDREPEGEESHPPTVPQQTNGGSSGKPPAATPQGSGPNGTGHQGSETPSEDRDSGLVTSAS